MSVGKRSVPGPGDLERLRVALAFCLAVERDDGTGIEVLRSSVAPEGLIRGLVIAIRSLAHAVSHSTGEQPQALFCRLINDVMRKEAARWW